MGRKGGGRNAFVKATLHKNENEAPEESADEQLQDQREPDVQQIDGHTSPGRAYRECAL